MLELAVSQILVVDVFLATLAGVLLGLLIGAMPGLNVTMALALLIPVSIALPTGPGIALLVGIFMAGMTGGAFSAILLNIPGTPASAATLLDGHPLAKRGDGGRALGIAVSASSFGGVVSLLILMLVAPQLANVAGRFGPPEVFALVLFGVLIIAGVSSGSVVKGLVSTALGLFVMTIGLDPLTSTPRFTFGIVELQRGVSLIPAMIGLFAIPQVLEALRGRGSELAAGIGTRVGRVRPSFADLRFIVPASMRSSGIGTALGIIPGTNGAVAAFMAYEISRRAAKDSSKFGDGDLRGIASAEASNSGITGGAMVPLLTLGIPGDNITAVLLGALLLHGLAPGPLLFDDSPDVVALIFGALLLANLLTVLVSFGGLKAFVQVLRVPKRVLFPVIVVLSVAGAYAVSASFFDVWVMVFFGFLGYLLTRHGFPIVPVLIGIVLGPALEGNLRRSLALSGGDFGIFVQRPIAATLLVMALLVVFGPPLWKYARRRSTPDGPAGTGEPDGQSASSVDATVSASPGQDGDDAEPASTHQRPNEGRDG